MKTNVRHQPFKSLLLNNQRQIIGALIFFIGLMLGFAFNGLAVIADLNGVGFWGDSQDAADLDREQPTRADLIKISCPILMAPGEEGYITATFRNTHPEKADILVKAVVSEGDFLNFRVVTGSLPLEPGDEQGFQWQIGRQDIVQKNFILSRVFLMNQERFNPYPARTFSCGVFILSIFGLKGASLVALMVMTGLLSLVAGSVLLYRKGSLIQRSSPRIDHGLYGLAGIILASMIANLLSLWIFAGLLLLLAVLLTCILFFNLINLRK